LILPIRLVLKFVAKNFHNYLVFQPPATNH